MTSAFQSYRDSETEVTISLDGANRRLFQDDIEVRSTSRTPRPGEARTGDFNIRLPAHSNRLFKFLE
jgi:hypothetical protein